MKKGKFDVVVTVISPVGTFKSDVAQTGAQTLGRLRLLLESASELPYLEIRQGAQVVYFPRGLSQNSAIILESLPAPENAAQSP